MRRKAFLEAFRTAGPRGLTGKQMREHAGPRGNTEVLQQLFDLGYLFRTGRSRFGTRGPWRWILVYEPPAPGTPVDDPQAEQGGLFVPAAPRPTSAIIGDDGAE